MKDMRKLPRLDFAAVALASNRKFPSVIDLSPRLELGLSVITEAEDEIPDGLRTENQELITDLVPPASCQKL